MPATEKSLIRRIRQLSGKPALARIPLGIGDDAAVLRVPAPHEVLITTDFSLEGVHFRREWHSPESIGHRCLTRGLSDIAAMGGQPLAAFLSLALPAKLPQRWVDGFLRGLLGLAHQQGITLAGGDTAQSPGAGSNAKILADIVVVGSAPRGKALRRAGAKPGDSIYVTGELGASAFALEALLAQPKKKLDPKMHPAHFYPQPRLAVGRYLRERGIATSMIDVSDGLSTELHHLCEQSRVSAYVAAELIPRAHDATLEHALHGGEDYELLFTAPANRKVPRSIAGVAVTRIGKIRSGPARVSLLEGLRRRELRPGGWEHFNDPRRSSGKRSSGRRSA
jgi:thiamine-monophosphate kinase